MSSEFAWRRVSDQRLEAREVAKVAAAAKQQSRTAAFRKQLEALQYRGHANLCRARQHNWGSATSALHLTLNLCTFWHRRCVMNKRRNPFRKLASKQRKNQEHG